MAGGLWHMIDGSVGKIEAEPGRGKLWLSEKQVACLLHGVPDVQGPVRHLLRAEGEQGGVHKGGGRVTCPEAGHGAKDSLHLVWRQRHLGSSLQEGGEDMAVHLY